RLWFWLLRVRVPSATPSRCSTTGFHFERFESELCSLARSAPDPRACAKLNGRWWATMTPGEHFWKPRHSSRVTPENRRRKKVTNSSFLLQRMLRICSLARHVHKAQQHMAIFDTLTITR